jgi:hypothetical protein
LKWRRRHIDINDYELNAPTIRLLAVNDLF